MIAAQLLAGKTALYGIAALAALLVASNLGWWAAATGLRADLREAAAENRVLVTEREAWKSKAGELAEANRGWQETIATLRTELALAQGEALRLDAEGRAAIAAARADAAAAARRAAEFNKRYAGQRAVPDCAGALAAVQQHCPQFEGY